VSDITDFIWSTIDDQARRNGMPVKTLLLHRVRKSGGFADRSFESRHQGLHVNTSKLYIAGKRYRVDLP
jgi:hypothetical protein